MSAAPTLDRDEVLIRVINFVMAEARGAGAEDDPEAENQLILAAQAIAKVTLTHDEATEALNLAYLAFQAEHQLDRYVETRPEYRYMALDQHNDDLAELCARWVERAVAARSFDPWADATPPAVSA